MSTDSVPVEELDRETLRDRLRVAEQRLALAEAQLALGKIATAPTWLPTDGRAAAVADRLHDLAPALDVLFHTAGVAMVLLAGDGTILRANQVAAEFWGYPLAELAGRRTTDMTIESDIVDNTDRLRRNQRGQFLLKTYRRGDGTPVEALALGWPLKDDDGDVICLIGVAVPLRRISSAPSMVDQVMEYAAENEKRRSRDAD